MKHRYIIVLVFLLFFTACGQKSKDNETEILRLGGWDYTWMKEVRSGLDSEDQTFKFTYDQLISDAENVLKEGVYSVTFKKIVPPSGSKHDYMSMGPYWWPDPDQPDGLPYIRRDGEVNPERGELDSPQLSGMVNGVRVLSLAWFFSGNNRYAEKAAELIRVWFLDAETLMNPHLEYGQSIPGRVTGRGIGIIDTRGFYTLVDAIALLESSNAITDDEKNAIRAWFEKYFQWLTESKLGNDEDNTSNNHATAYDVQVCGIAYFLGNDQFVQSKIREVPERRINPQIKADGSQPLELARTRSFSYSLANLQNFFDSGELGLKVGIDIFQHVNPEGGSIKKALDYLIDYIGREEDWEYEQITSWEQVENNLGLLIRRAAGIYPDDSYHSIWNKTFAGRVNTDWRLLVVPYK